MFEIHDFSVNSLYKPRFKICYNDQGLCTNHNEMHKSEVDSYPEEYNLKCLTVHMTHIWGLSADVVL